MINVKFFGVTVLDLNTRAIELAANNIKELIEKLKLNFPSYNTKKWKDCLYFVNGEAISKLKMFRTKLKSEDIVLVMSPVSGG